MKFKTTRKAIQDGYHRILSVGYCELQHLLKYQSPVAYSAGVYGWNADYYIVEGVLIATGYRSLPNSRNTKCDYNTARKYDNMAQGNKTKEEIDQLLKAFIAEVTI